MIWLALASRLGPRFWCDVGVQEDAIVGHHISTVVARVCGVQGLAASPGWWSSGPGAVLGLLVPQATTASLAPDLGDQRVQDVAQRSAKLTYAIDSTHP
jgi:hypothetical protein